MTDQHTIPPTYPGIAIASRLKDTDALQKDLAAELGLSQQFVTDIIKGRRRLSNAVCRRLSAVFADTPTYWFELQQACDLAHFLEETETL